MTDRYNDVHDPVDRDDEQQARVMNLRNANERLREQFPAVESLLAVIHRDGGHYAHRHGKIKACLDAQNIIHQDRAALMELRNREARRTPSQTTQTLHGCPTCGEPRTVRECRTCRIDALEDENERLREQLEAHWPLTKETKHEQEEKT